MHIAGQPLLTEEDGEEGRALRKQYNCFLSNLCFNEPSNKGVVEQ